MKRSVLIAMLLCAALPWADAAGPRGSAAASPAAAPPLPEVRVRTLSGADSVTVGQRLRVVYELSYPDSLAFLPPESFDTGTCRLLSVVWKEKKSGGAVTTTAELEVVTTDLERAHVPAMPFLFVAPSGDTLSALSDEVSAGVRRLTQAGGEPKPLKPQWEAPRSGALAAALALAALVLAALALLVYRRRRKRKVVEILEPELPADFTALQRLDEIERMNLLEAGEFKRHYSLVVDVLRHYAEKRWGVVAMDRTTDEILWELRRLDVATAEIEPALREADLVKFAKHRPGTSEAKSLAGAVRAFVARTAARPLAEARSA